MGRTKCFPHDHLDDMDDEKDEGTIVPPRLLGLFLTGLHMIVMAVMSTNIIQSVTCIFAT